MEWLLQVRKSVMGLLKVLSVAALGCMFNGFLQSFYTEAAYSTTVSIVIVFSYLLVFVVFCMLYGGFKIGVQRIHELIYSQGLSIVFADIIVYFELCLIARRMLSPLWLLLCVAIQLLLIIVCVYALTTVYFRLYEPKKILVIFSRGANNDIVKKMANIKERYVMYKGITADRGYEEIVKQIDEYQSILICDLPEPLKGQILNYCYSNAKRIYMLPSPNDVIRLGCHFIQISDVPVLYKNNTGLSPEQVVIKRFFDILFSFLAILITSPIMLITAIAIKINDGGPVLFKQKRITKDNREFEIYKFRSMIVDADKINARKAITDDDRITAVGKVIRSLRIDELPQFFNVLKGDMSVVGPRPERIENVAEYTEMLPEFNLRHQVNTGLTGYAQIYGKYNTSPEHKLNMDLYYIENYSFLEDIKMIVMTFKILFVKESTEGFEEKNSKVKQIEKDKDGDANGDSKN